VSRRTARSQSAGDRLMRYQLSGAKEEIGLLSRRIVAH
jgi:hypothetical protein